MSAAEPRPAEPSMGVETGVSQRREALSSGSGLHRFALLLVGFVILLIVAGANVTSRDAGLSVPDWPLSYGSLNPPRWWEIQNVRAEHGHRLLAAIVATLSVILVVWSAKREPRLWVRRLTLAAVGAVLTQALLGGLTVLFFLPTAVSVGHAALAQIFLGLTVSVAVATSPSWQGMVSMPRLPARYKGLAPLATALTGLVFVQLLVGAVMRHSGAGLAIPDFPLVFGGLFPPELDFAISVHYAHRVGALVIALLVAVVAFWVWRWGGRLPSLILPAGAILVLLPCQITLGAVVVLSGRAAVPNTVHVATGALILASSLVLSLFSWRLRLVTGSGIRFSPLAEKL